MSDIAERQFVRQQGFRDVSAPSCARYPALMFQPRVVAGLFILGVALQSAPVFLVLAGVLGWNALVPTRNPFDALYNLAVARRRGLPPLTPAPAPRRFSQGMGGTLLAGVGLALLAGWPAVAWTLEGLVAAALGALVLGRLCVGSYLYYVLRGEVGFANRTLPWSRAE